MGAHGTPHLSEAAPRLTNTVGLGAPVSRLRGMRSDLCTALGRMGISTVRELLLHVPHRYLDFTHVSSIAAADVGSTVTVVARVDRIREKTPRRNMHVLELSVVDETGLMQVVFFKQRWLARQFAVGDWVAFSGKVTFNYGFKQMVSPFHETVLKAGEAASAAADPSSLERILPVHGLTQGISAGWMRRIVSTALGSAGDVVDPVEPELLGPLGLMSEARALRAVHFPASMAEAEAARQRLAFDELLFLQLALLCRRELDLAGVQPVAHVTNGPHVAALRAALPFALTEEQEQAVREILDDMAAPQVMRRLLLGDVGTGKTAVAAFCLAAAADTGTQAAMMAPTSVLASQYAAKLGPLLDEIGVSWALVTGQLRGAERERVEADVAAGRTTVVFGTTAVLSEGMEFVRLSAAVVDEQHRFGVDQRAALRRKGVGADLLTMTATPIPRTLALSVYGDVACSRIRQRPSSGAGYRTQAITPENVDLAYAAIRDAVDAGQQAYVVCPMVDESDEAGEDLPGGVDDVPESQRAAAAKLHAATVEAQRMGEIVFPQFEVGLIHGRLSAAEKDEVMTAFRDGRIDVLVSTTVIEVGVDVPNATVMLVMDADRFGLATLHQLRGRVGRGPVEGQVFLESAARKRTAARERLTALEQTSDGYELAELDLRLRREGEVLGYRQSGGVSLHLVDLEADSELVEIAHAAALDIASDDPRLEDASHVPYAQEVRARYRDVLDGLN